EQFDPMAVGIAEIHVHGMTGAMPAGTALDTAAKPERAGDIAGVEDVVAFGARECSVMQARTRLLEEHDVVRIALALQEDAGEFSAPGHDLFAQPEARGHVELARLAHVGHQNLKVIDAGGGATPV